MSEHTHYAYGADRSELETVMRLGAVKRWHMIDTTRVQNLGEHSANVALLAYVIAMRAPGSFFGPAFHVLSEGLLHDLAEVFTGDIPSHTKRLIGGVTELERAVLPKIFTTEISPEVKRLIKVCDLADGIRFVRLHGVDITSEHAMVGLENQMEFHFRQMELEWPEHVWTHVKEMVTFYAYEEV